MHSGFDKKATAASGCILMSIDKIVRAHDSTFCSVARVFSALLLFVGEPIDGDDEEPWVPNKAAPVEEADLLDLTFSSSVLCAKLQ